MAKTNQQVIVTQGDFGIELLVQFIDANKKPVNITDCSCKVKFAYDGQVVAEKIAVIIDEVKGIASVILDEEETQFSNLWTSYWIVYDAFNNVTATENIYYYVQPAIGSSSSYITEQLLKYYTREEVDKMIKNILYQLNNYTLSKEDVDVYIKEYVDSKIDKNYINQRIDEVIGDSSDYASNEDLETVVNNINSLTSTVNSNKVYCNQKNTELTNNINTVSTNLENFKTSTNNQIATLENSINNSTGKIEVLDKIKYVKSVSDLKQALKTPGIVLISGGDYLVDTPLEYTSYNTIGAIGTVTLKYELGNQNIMFRPLLDGTEGEYTGVTNVEINDIIFDGQNKDNISYGLFSTAHANKIKINRCTFKDVCGRWHAVEINSSKDVVFDLCTFDGYNVGVSDTRQATEMIQLDYAGSTNQYPFTYKIDKTRCMDISFKQCHFRNMETSLYGVLGSHTFEEGYMPVNVKVLDSHVENIDNFIYAKNYTNLLVRDTEFYNVATAVITDKISATGTTTFQLINNIYDGRGRNKNIGYLNGIPEGRFLFDASSNIFSGACVITGNKIVNAYSHAIGITPNDAVITNNQIKYAGKHGIYLYGFKNSVVTGNNCCGNGTLNTSSYKDGYISSGAVGTAKSSNTLVKSNLGTWATDGQSYSGLYKDF